MIEHLVAALYNWTRLTRAVESVLIDAIAATSPWLAPVIPAFMCWQSMVTHLAFPAWVALAGAGVVELLGLATVTTTMQFWDYNNTRRLMDQTAPVYLAAGTALFYLTVVLTVNVMMDDSPTSYKIAKALLSSLSICAAVTLAIRSQHSRRLASIEQQRKERREARQVLRAGNLPELAGNLPVNVDWRNLPDMEKVSMQSLSANQIAAKYGISERTARNWRAHSHDNGGNHDGTDTEAAG